MNNNHLTTDDLIDYLHGELEPELDARVHAHLTDCEPCLQAFQAEAALTDALRAHLGAEEREMPPMVKAVVWERIRNARPHWASGFFTALRPVVAVPVTAAVALGLYFGLPVFHSTQAAATVAASYYLDAHAAGSVDTPLADRIPSFNAASGVPITDRPAVAPEAITAATLDDTQAP